MAKAFRYPDGRVCFMCPGCKGLHVVPTLGSYIWQWNDNLDIPTLSPSILISRPANISINSPKITLCHSFVTDGKIRFLDDCAHDLKNQEVELPELNYRIEEGEVLFYNDKNY